MAAAAALYLGLTTLLGEAIAGCGPESGCGEVLTSRWAYWFGVPVSLLAVPVYVGLLWLVTRGGRQHGFRHGEVMAIWGLGVAVIGAALWFLVLQAAVIGGFCPYCLTVHCAALFGVGVLMISLSRRFVASAGDERAPVRAISVQHLGRAAGLGLVAVAALIVGQWLGPESTGNAVTVRDEAAAEGRAAVDTIRLHGGQFTLRLDQLPVLGSRQADNLLVALFDYTCIHCRSLHRKLEEVQNELGEDKLSVIPLHCPLETKCNAAMQRLKVSTQTPHIGACDYARLALAVWRTDTNAFYEFDRRLFRGDKCPPLRFVRQIAANLVGKERLEHAMTDPWITAQITRNTRIYDANFQKHGRGAMPQLFIGHRITFGDFRSVDDLYQILEQEFGSEYGKPDVSGQTGP